MQYYYPDVKSNVLLVSDNDVINSSVLDLIEERGHYVESGVTMQDIIEKIHTGKFDIVIIDIIYLINYNSHLLKKIKKADPDIDIILITGSGLINIAVQFMKDGVYDFITRPINRDHLDAVLRKAIERRELVKAARERDIYRHLSHIDSLTGLYNHKFFQDQIAREIDFSRRKNKDFSLLLMDLDNFKTINDSFGHQAGDSVLREVSLHIAENCRKYDTIARYGGEEFGVILSGVSTGLAEKIAGRILETIASSSYEQVNANVTASIGISTFPGHSESKEDLIKKADSALYFSKENGKNTYTIYETNCDSCLV